VSVPPARDGLDVEGLTALAVRIRNVHGWLAPREAWELHEVARRAAEETEGRGRAVEIGSWRGRSTVVIALGLRAGGGGRLMSIDPHELADERHAEVQRNLEEAGLRDLVDVVRAFSHDARPQAPDGAADLVFIDGDHAYESVRQDLDDWASAVRPGGVIAFNDPLWPGPARLLLERATRTGAVLRNGRLIVNTMFFDYRPDAAWTAEDAELARRLRRMLQFGRVWYRALRRMRRWHGHRPATERFARSGGWVLRRLYPAIDLVHYGQLGRPDGPGG
jgi:MMP 1-O-methyltransferase